MYLPVIHGYILTLVIVMAFDLGEANNKMSPTSLPACTGSNVHFGLNTSEPIKYCHFGGTEGNNLDVKPLDMSVRNSNEITNANTTLSQRLEFEGNLSAGDCSFVLNFKKDDRKGHRISLMEVGNKGTKKMDFEIIEDNCTNSTVTDPTTTKAPSTGPAITAKAEAENVTSSPNTTSIPSNSISDTRGKTSTLLLVGIIMISILGVFDVIAIPCFIYKFLERRLAQQQQQRDDTLRDLDIELCKKEEKEPKTNRPLDKKTHDNVLGEENVQTDAV